MAENKTKPTKGSVTAFLNKIKDPQVRDDCFAILEMMQKVTKHEPVMWGSAIVGFGTYHYVYESGREGDTIVIGFSPRKQNISLYLMGGLKNIDIEKLEQENPKALEARQLRDTYQYFGCKPGFPTYRYDIIDAVKDPEGPFL